MSDLADRAVRNVYATYMTHGQLNYRAEPDADFDRWLAEVKAAAWSEGHSAALHNVAWPLERRGNPYASPTSADARPHDRGPEACWCGSLHTYADGAERTDVQP